MPWNECNRMDERLRFVARILEGEKMAVACREFGISRKTGYKLFTRYRDAGIKGLEDRARSPYRHPNKTPFQIEKSILRIKQEHSSWGAPKIREKLIKEFSMIEPPAVSTIHAILDRHDLVSRRRRRRYRAEGTPLHDAQTPNALWCADFKGQFRLGNQRYCYPLTITDYRSRFLLACEGLECTRESGAFPVFERVFKDFGLPTAIRTDNGVPFASPHALFGLSKLAVWWLRLGIAIERIKPGNPQQNGRHERMHLTLKKEATKPPSFNFLQQQERFERFIEGYNNDRPHQGLGGLDPAEVYTPSARAFFYPDRPEYPYHERVVLVTQCGRICIGRRKISFSSVFAGQFVGVREVADDVWLVSFMDYDLGFFDRTVNRVEPVGENPFALKVLPMSSE
jgi:transposase InsO family protein